jgi:site-specific recombinase XerD
MRPPKVPEQPPQALTHEQLRAVLTTCAGQSFKDRRDHAMIRVLLDTGCRLSELVGITLEDVDLDQQQVVLLQTKGRSPRVVGLGNKTVRALDRYLRARRMHHDSGTEALWLGTKGPLTRWGIRQICGRRGAQAGLPDCIRTRSATSPRMTG